MSPPNVYFFHFRRKDNCEICGSISPPKIEFSSLPDTIIHQISCTILQTESPRIKCHQSITCTALVIETNPVLGIEWLTDNLLLCAFEQSNTVYIVDLRKKKLKIEKGFQVNDDIKIGVISYWYGKPNRGLHINTTDIICPIRPIREPTDLEQCESTKELTGMPVGIIGCSNGDLIPICSNRLLPSGPVLFSHACAPTSLDFSAVSPYSLAVGFQSGHVCLFGLSQEPMDVSVTAIKFLPASGSLLAISYQMVRELWIYNMYSTFNPVHRIDSYVIAMESRPHYPYLYCAFDERMRDTEQPYIRALNFLRMGIHSASSVPFTYGHVCCLGTSTMGGLVLSGTSTGQVHAMNTSRRSKNRFTLGGKNDQVICTLVYVSDECQTDNRESVFQIMSIHEMNKNHHLELTTEMDVRLNKSLKDDRQMYPNSIMQIRFLPKHEDVDRFVIGTYGGVIAIVGLTE